MAASSWCSAGVRRCSAASWSLAGGLATSGWYMKTWKAPWICVSVLTFLNRFLFLQEACKSNHPHLATCSHNKPLKHISRSPRILARKPALGSRVPAPGAHSRTAGPGASRSLPGKDPTAQESAGAETPLARGHPATRAPEAAALGPDEIEARRSMRDREISGRRLVESRA